MKNIHILSTRKIEAGLIAAAERAGIYIDETEFIQTTPVASAELAEQVSGLGDHSHLVFTSANAVEALNQLIKQFSISMPAPAQVFSVDGRTSRTIHALFPAWNVVATAESAAALAGEIIKQKVRQVHFVCGNLRRDELPEILEKQQVKVDEIEIYQTKATPVSVGRDYDGLIFFSPSAVSSFLSVNSMAPAATCFTIGETTAALLREKVGNNIVAASKPRQENIIEEIIKYYRQHG